MDDTFVKGFSELIPYLNKMKILLNINLIIDSLQSNTLNFIKDLLTNLKISIYYNFNLIHENGKNDTAFYEDFKKLIYNLCTLKKEKLLDNLYSIEINYPQINEILNMDDFKEYLNDLVLGYPKFILS